MAVKDITDSTFDTEIGNGMVLVDFWATWCGPCRTISPMVEELSQDYAGKIQFAKMDVDANQQTAQKFNVTALPTLMLYKGGKPIDKLVGAVPKPHLKSFLEKHITQ